MNMAVQPFFSYCSSKVVSTPAKLVRPGESSQMRRKISSFLVQLIDLMDHYYSSDRKPL